MPEEFTGGLGLEGITRYDFNGCCRCFRNIFFAAFAFAIQAYNLKSAAANK